MDVLEHESSEKVETSSSLGPGGSNDSNADSSNPGPASTCTWQEIFKSRENPNYGYVDSLEEAMLLLKKYEQETTTKFSCYKSDKMFGSGDPFGKPRKIFFKGERVPFDGVPFMIIGSKIFDCQHGPDRKKNEKNKSSTQKDGDHSFRGRRFLPQDTIKFGCPAKILMSEVIKFPGYKILDNTERIRRDMSDRLRGDIKNGMWPQFERRIYINLPMEKDHKDHVTGEIGGMLQPIDKSLVQKIHTLVGEGVKKVDEMKRHLRHYVKNDLFGGQNPPPVTNRRYHPKDVDIRNHMYKATVKQMLSKVDQENLEEKIKGWKQESPEDFFFFRPCSLSPTEAVSDNTSDTDGNVEAHVTQNLLFAHQTAWQRHLMSRYGNEIMLLDATYKTMRYELPLFFLVVKTNVNYTVVGAFITQNETKAAIEEALKIFRAWNPNWKPQYFMTDFCHEEINAIESTFEDTTTYICDFHREQCWERWLRKADNGLNHQREEVLSLLRNVARSPTEDIYERNLKSLKASELWMSNPQLRNWFEKTWLPEAKRWVWAYRQERFLVAVNTNNGIERQNESFKYQYLKDRNKCTLSGMITILVAEFLPDKYQRYVELNTRCSGRYKRYNQSIPTYLQDKPRQFLSHCMNRISAAEEISPEEIREGKSKGEFHVVSAESKDIWYELSFGADDKMPKCSCPDFSRTGLLCKHFFAVFQHNADWKWEALPKSFRENPHLCLDDDVVFQTKLNIDSIAEDPIEPPLPVFVPQPQIQPKMTAESEILSKAMKCRETLKQITSLTYNIEDISALKELASSLHLIHDKFLCYQVTDENTTPVLKNQNKNEKKAKEYPTKKYLPLPVRRKRNAFASRVGERASIMQNQYFVNVPVDGNIYVKKRKNKRVQKRTQQLPLSHFTNQQPTGKKRQLSPTRDDVHVQVPTANQFKKTKYEATTNSQTGNQPTKPKTNQQMPNNQANTQYPPNPATTIESHQEPIILQSHDQIRSNHQQTKPTNKKETSQQSTKVIVDDQPSQKSTKQANNPAAIKTTIIKQPKQKTTNQFNKKQGTDNQQTQQPTPSSTKNQQQTKLAASQQNKPTTNNQQPINQSHTPAVIVVDDNSPDTKPWVHIQDPNDPKSTFTLYEDARGHILKKTNWLCDSEIHAGQLLLKAKFPFMDGLHDPAITGTLVAPAISEFVQIINTGNHWVCLSTISCRPGTIKVHDSLFQRVSPIAIRHSCRLLMHTGGSILFTNEKVQKQINSSDCGLFALAFATDLCHGIDPVMQSYDQEKMRAHYVNCLDSLEMVPFPKTTRRVPYHPHNSKATVDIFCVCRMPNDNQEYVQCFQCNGWYHPTCVDIPNWVINSKRRWRCETCRGKNAKKAHLNKSTENNFH